MELIFLATAMFGIFIKDVINYNHIFIDYLIHFITSIGSLSPISDWFVHIFINNSEILLKYHLETL
jgi:hypothetical protein